MKYNKLFATLADSELEKEFLEHERESILKYLRPGMLVLGIIFFLFIIPDYFLNPSAQVFKTILVTRAVFLILIVFFFIMLGKKEIQSNLHNWISVYALIVTVSYLLIYYQYEASGGSSPFFVQSLAVVVFILIFFSIDSHWLHMVIISFLLSAGFIVVTGIRQEGITPSGVFAVYVYILLALVISSFSAYRINIYKRMQFISRCELKRLSEEDGLTGIYNRSKFDKELDRWLDLARRYEHSFAMIMFDIDNLKTINDLYSHITGDKVLIEFAGLVQKELRSSDIFARWGGDEFIILLPNTGLDQAVQMAERIRDVVMSHNFNQVGTVSCSFGVAVYEKGDDRNTIVQRVDNRLYSAKKNGKRSIISE